MSTVSRKPPRRQRRAVSTRLDAATVARLDALAPLIAPLDTQPARFMALRACLFTRLDVLEARHAQGRT
jgi:hypothetical protein